MRPSLIAPLTASILILTACGDQDPEVTESKPPAADAAGAETDAVPPEAEASDAAADVEPAADDAEKAANNDESGDDKPADDSGEVGIGGRAEVGDYSVAVTAVDVDAAEVLKGANAFNEDPEGEYVLVSLAVTYTGEEEGDPWVDLYVELAGSDSRIYDTSSCEAVTPNPVFDLPTLTAGGTGEFDVCFDVPAEALDEFKINVENSFSWTDSSKRVWDPNTEAAADDDPSEAASGSEATRAEDAHALGSAAEVGEYSVIITEVDLNALDTIKAASSFNDDPEGQYVLISAEVTYNGTEESDVWLDLTFELAGSDARIYDSSCMAVLPNERFDVPTLTTGGKGEFDVCFDVPTEALDNPQIYVTESLSFDDNREVWESQ